MAFIDEEATDCINEKAIGTINDAAISAIISLQEIQMFVVLFHVLLFQLHQKLRNLIFQETFLHNNVNNIIHIFI